MKQAAVQEALKAAPRLQELYGRIVKECGYNRDIPIALMFEWLYGDDKATDNMQQYIGSYISRFNRRLRAHKIRIVPGERKQTYRLTRD